MKQTLLILCLLLAFGTVKAQDKNDATWEETIGFIEKYQSSFIIDGVIRADGSTYEVKTLVFKVMPNAIYETIKEFFAESGANLDKSKNFNAQLSSDVRQMVEQLINKSEALNFLRTSLYRINEASFNEDISQEVYIELIKTIIVEASKIQQLEINK